MKNYLESLNDKKMKSLRSAHSSKQDWTSLHALATQIFNRIKEDARSANFYDSLYIIDNQHSMIQTKPNFTKFIQFYIGGRPSGRYSQEFDSHDRLLSSEIEVINGGALVITQSPAGEIVMEMFPDTIKGRNPDAPFVYSSFRKAGDVKYHHIKEAAEDFLNYIIITSPNHSKSCLDKVELYFIQRKYKEDAWPVAKGLAGWVLRILSFFKGVWWTA